MAWRKEPAEAGSYGQATKQIYTRSIANENHTIRLQSVDQKQVSLGATFTAISPVTLNLMTQPLQGNGP